LAFVWLDGRALGETPLGDVPVTVGEHVFCGRLADGRHVEAKLEIDRDGLLVCLAGIC